MKGTVVEWAPAIIMGVLFAGTVGTIGFGTATDFLFLTNSDSTEAQLSNLASKVKEQCNAPTVPGTQPSVSIPEYENDMRFDDSSNTMKANLDSGSWESEEINNCEVTVNGFDDGPGNYDVEINSQNPSGSDPEVTVEGIWTSQAVEP
jgi:hypothetical protein